MNCSYKRIKLGFDKLLNVDRNIFVPQTACQFSQLLVALLLKASLAFLINTLHVSQACAETVQDPDNSVNFSWPFSYVSQLSVAGKSAFPIVFLQPPK